MPVETLTDARVRSAAPPKTGILELWDGKTSGLCFRVMKSGVRSWTFRYRPHSGAAFRRVTLGRYPALSLVEARGAAERLRDRVRTGADPQQQTRSDREALRAAPEALTFDALADLYIERYAKRQKASWKNDEGYLRANARPAWGQRNAASITSQDAARLLFDVVDVAPVSANRLRSVLVKLFGWACESALLSGNPMLGVKKPHREGKGKTRTLNDQEIRVLWHALEKAEAAPGIVAALKCLLLLGQRPGEVAGMAVSELHHLNNDRTAHWELPPSRMKARRTHVVPLPRSPARLWRSRSRGRATPIPRVSRCLSSPPNLPSARGWRGIACRRRWAASSRSSTRAATMLTQWRTSRSIGRRRMISDARSRPDWHALGSRATIGLPCWPIPTATSTKFTINTNGCRKSAPRSRCGSDTCAR